MSESTNGSTTMSDEERLNAHLAENPAPQYNDPGNRASVGQTPDGPPTRSRALQPWDLQQWAESPGVRRPVSLTRKTLEAGHYLVQQDDQGVYVAPFHFPADELLELPDQATTRVLDGIRRFWKARARYEQCGIVYKRGVLLWGPPGAGKTVLLTLLGRELIAQDGLVIFCAKPNICAQGLRIVRQIEPARPLIVVIEDLDELVRHHGEHEVLAMLDGEYSTDNVVFLATTNYPENLGARILNRPSRFDERIFIGMPSPAARRVYLERWLTDRKVTAGKRILETWVKDTEGLSIAHLRELVAAVMCLEQPYADVLERLKAMAQRPEEVDGFKPKGKVGLH